VEAHVVTAERGIVIVGGGLAGAKAAEEFRSAGFDGRVILVGRERELPYERPPLSKSYLTGRSTRQEAHVHASAWYAEHEVELHLGQPATAIDRGAHAVVLADGTRLPYDRLLLATGAAPRRLEVPGADLNGVTTLRTLPDAVRLRDTLRTLGRENGALLVVGGGWLGLEVAAAARGYGAEVTVAEVDPTPLHGVLGKEVGAFFTDLHHDHGVRFEFGARITEIHGQDGMVLAAATADGDELPAHAVVVAVGVEPCVEPAASAGLDLATAAEGGGIAVDAQLRTSDPDIFAAGDAAAVMHPHYGRRMRVEHWANALHSGPLAARAMLGQDVRWERLPYFFSDQYDLGLEYTGHAPPGSYDRVVLRGDPGKREFLAFWMAGDQVLAGMNVNVWKVTPSIRQLIAARLPVDPERLADPGVPLAELAGAG
jgi:NADPH-dependent 2,4-dienoyl-CoA reductase/sulfur reductase-like enzyme